MYKWKTTRPAGDSHRTNYVISYSKYNSKPGSLQEVIHVMQNEVGMTAVHISCLD